MPTLTRVFLARYEYLAQSSQRGAAAQTNDHEEPGLPDMVAGATQRLTNRAAEVSAILHPNCQSEPVSQYQTEAAEDRDLLSSHTTIFPFFHPLPPAL
jgi:hypothetical protein